MKSRILLIGLVLLLALSIHSYANVYATNVEVSSNTLQADGTATVTISFILNEAADNGVDVKIYNSDTDLIKTISLATAPKGLNTVDWDGTYNDGVTIAASGKYTIEVTASDDGYTAWTKISDNTKTAIYSPRGIAVNRNPDSPYFGRIYVTNKATGTSTNTGAFETIQGILMYTQDQELIGQSTGGVAWPSSTTGSPHKVMVGPDDMVYVGDYANDRLYAFDAEIDATSQKLVIGDSNKETGQYIAGHWVTGTGADRAIYTADGHYGDYTGIKKYDIGLNDVMPDGNVGYEIIQRPSGLYYQYDVEVGSDGSIYFCEFRSAKGEPLDKDGNPIDLKAAGEAYPLIKYKPWVDDGSQTPYTLDDTLWTVTKQLTGSRGIGLDETRNRVAFCDYYSNKVYIFDATTGDLVETVNSTLTKSWDVAFDAAGNMYLMDNSAEYWTITSPPDGPNSYTTPCPETVTVTGPPDVVINEFDSHTSAAEYIEVYNTTDAAIDLDAGGYVLVFVNGSGEVIYQATALNGTIPANGYYVLAESGVTDIEGYTPDQNATWTSFQNGADGVALVKGASVSAFTNTDYATTLAASGGTQIDAVIYGGDDAELNIAFGTTAVNLSAGYDGSTSRKSDGQGGAAPAYGNEDWQIQERTPGATNTLPPGFINAYPSSGTTVTIKYNCDMASVAPANYSLLGTSGVTFTSAVIDPVDASIVTLTADAEIMYDLILDTLVDVANTDTAVFYAGITPIGWTSTTNPGGHIENGYAALFQGYVSANDAYNNVWVNDAEGGEHSGVIIYDYNFDALVAVGDHITFVAERTEYNNLTELENPVLLSINSSGNDPYGPFEITGADIDTSIAADTDPAEKWEGQLVKIDSAVVISGPTNYTYLCTDDDSTTYFYVGDNVDYHLSNVVLTVGSAYDIVGVVDYDGDYYRINPRGADDIKKYIAPGELDIIEDFATADDIANWRSDNAGYTARAHLDTVMQLSDGGWTFDARRTVTAEPNTFFKATATIKTGSFNTSTSQYLYFGIDGLGDEPYQVSCISEDDFTTFTIIGYAINETGSLYIAGQGREGADTVWVDEYSYQNNYVPGLTTLSTVAEARAVPVGEKVATIGVVTTTTHFGSAGAVFFQDATAGYAVYNYNCAQTVELGDEILVIGTQKDYNGLLEIDPMVDFMVLSKGNEVVPVVITAADMDGEAYEGMLVTIEACDTLDSGLDWASTAGSNKGFNLSDSNDSTFYCYIDKDTDIDGSPKPPMWPIDITGIVGDYKGAQLLPRSLADFSPCNQVPTAFEIVSPADSTVISSFDHADIKKIEVGTDSLYALVIKWTKSVDPDGDDISYEVVVLPSGSYEEIVTTDTMTYMVLENEKPWVMNGTYDVFVVAADTMGGKTPSDTIAITFDFEAPPEIVYADVVLVDGAPKLYALFSLPVDAAAVGNFTILDQTVPGAVAPMAVDSIAPNAIRITGNLPEDHHIALAYNGITAPGSTISTADTVYAGKVLIPFSENHPEDAAKVITPFESNIGSFLDPDYSGSTVGINADATTFAVSDEQAYRGSKSGKMTIVDDPAIAGGWYVRELYGYPWTYNVSTTSTLMIMVKGTDAEVEMRLSIKDTGYEQGPWTRVSVTEDDWQVVSFDLQNDEAEGWINGNGIVEGDKVLIEGIHIRCTEDKDVVLYFDEFTQRPNSNSAPSAVTLLKPTDGYEITDADVVQDSLIEVKWTKAVDPDGDKVSYEFYVLDADQDTVVDQFSTGDTTKLIDAPTYEDNGSYKVYVLAKDVWGAFSSSDTISITVNMPEVGIDGELGLPKVFALHQNYPNPFNPITTIKYDLPKDAHVRIMIYDLMGRQVRTLVNARQQAGYQTIQWDARDNYGKMVSSGYYLYVMQADKFHKTHKMILLK